MPGECRLPAPARPPARRSLADARRERSRCLPPFAESLDEHLRQRRSAHTLLCCLDVVWDAMPGKSSIGCFENTVSCPRVAVSRLAHASRVENLTCSIAQPNALTVQPLTDINTTPF